MARMRTMAALIAATIAGAAAALGVVACGSDDETNTGTVAVEEAETVDLRLTEYKIEPERVDVRAGVIEFVVRNDGDDEHALELETAEGRVERTDDLAPGEQTRFKVDLRPGTYSFYDPLGENRNRGMEGKIDVDERRTETKTTTDEEVTTETDERTVTDTDENTVTDTVTETDTRERTVTETETRTQTETETERR